MAIKRCADCSFKFETSSKGNMAKVCPSCRQGRKDKCHRDQEKKKPTPKSGKPTGF